MKIFCALLCALACINFSAGDGMKCTSKPPEIKSQWRYMADPCIKAMEAQVNVEINAALTYMAMGAYFSQDTVNRPGTSKLFFESANEEREHATKFLEYLLMRGQLTENGVSHLIKFPQKINSSWSNVYQVLQEALILEAKVTRDIQNIIQICESPKTESFNDYHLVDHVIGVFLDEQLIGQKKIADRIVTLGKMLSEGHDPLAEFLFDRKLLEGKI